MAVYCILACSLSVILILSRCHPVNCRFATGIFITAYNLHKTTSTPTHQVNFCIHTEHSSAIILCIQKIPLILLYTLGLQAISQSDCIEDADSALLWAEFLRDSFTISGFRRHRTAWLQTTLLSSSCAGCWGMNRFPRSCTRRVKQLLSNMMVRCSCISGLLSVHPRGLRQMGSYWYESVLVLITGNNILK